ncbi:Hypothetical protein PHPALM_16909 [Phytophthora palmivora]|uniref:Uncharacterized protein n=1 Tax=Phytophthora palmivora TaxID=4796 RepID=A0A2P4XNJ5_9STRA|nr:Hypothetical protein PHPALM_16909 [Phytophthora palmivora]
MVRNCVVAPDVTKFFETMTTLIIKERYDSSRISRSMRLRSSPDPDETSRRHSGLAQRLEVGSKCKLSPDCRCRPQRYEILRGLNAPGAVITTTDSGVMNKVLFSSWLPLLSLLSPRQFVDLWFLHGRLWHFFPYFSYGLQQLTRSSFCFKSKLRTALELIKDDMDEYHHFSDRT